MIELLSLLHLHTFFKKALLNDAAHLWADLRHAIRGSAARKLRRHFQLFRLHREDTYFGRRWPRLLFTAVTSRKTTRRYKEQRETDTHSATHPGSYQTRKRKPSRSAEEGKQAQW